MPTPHSDVKSYKMKFSYREFALMAIQPCVQKTPELCSVSGLQP